MALLKWLRAKRSALRTMNLERRDAQLCAKLYVPSTADSDGAIRFKKLCRAVNSPISYSSWQ